MSLSLACPFLFTGCMGRDIRPWASSSSPLPPNLPCRAAVTGLALLHIPQQDIVRVSLGRNFGPQRRFGSEKKNAESLCYYSVRKVCTPTGYVRMVRRSHAVGKQLRPPGTTSTHRYKATSELSGWQSNSEWWSPVASRDHARGVCDGDWEPGWPARGQCSACG